MVEAASERNDVGVMGGLEFLISLIVIAYLAARDWNDEERW